LIKEIRKAVTGEGQESSRWKEASRVHGGVANAVLTTKFSRNLGAWKYEVRKWLVFRCLGHYLPRKGRQAKWEKERKTK